jgi:hypothetical protein
MYVRFLSALPRAHRNVCPGNDEKLMHATSADRVDR